MSAGPRPLLLPLLGGADVREPLLWGVDLASRLGAELILLVVEDADLLHSAELPYVRQVNLLTATVESFDVVSTERELAVLRRRAEATLSSEAARRQVRWSVRVSRERRSQALLASSSREADLLLVPGPFRALGRHRAGPLLPGRPPRHRRGGASVTRAGRSLVVRDEGGPATRRLLATVARLLPTEPRSRESLVVLVTDREVGAVAEDVGQALPGRLAALHVRPLADGELTTLKAALTDGGCGLVLLDASSPLLAKVGLEGLLEGLPCPVLVVGGEDEATSGGGTPG